MNVLGPCLYRGGGVMGPSQRMRRWEEMGPVFMEGKGYGPTTMDEEVGGNEPMSS